MCTEVDTRFLFRLEREFAWFTTGFTLLLFISRMAWVEFDILVLCTELEEARPRDYY